MAASGAGIAGKRIFISTGKQGADVLIADGKTIPHVKSANFVSEYTDQINVAGVQTADYGKIVVQFGRDELSVSQEVFVGMPNGSFQLQTRDEDIQMTRYVFANLSMGVNTAKRLVEGLLAAIEQASGGNVPR